MDLVSALGVGVVYFCLEALYCFFIYFVSQGDAFKSATCSATITLMMGLGVLKIMENPAYLGPMVGGAWFGAFVIVAARGRKDR